MAFAQGRGSASSSAILLGLLLAALQCWAASAVTLDVGGASGWNVGVNYTTWVEGKSFAVGDILFFKYTQGVHDVLVVSEADYTSCTTTSPSNSYTTGNTNVTLSTTGNHYYICGYTGHCGAGQKLAVVVNGSTSNTTASPPPPPGTSSATSPPPPPPSSAQSLQIGAVVAFGLGCTLLVL